MPNSINFAPSSFFFTNPASISQTAAQAFGPVSADQFRLTAKFTVNGPGVKAFAVCTGVALVQPMAGSSTRVNLLLRPFSQPVSGLNIKYFIYRGLELSDFFASGKVIASGSDFINTMNAAFVAFHNDTDPGTPLPDFLAAYIGFDPAHQAATLPLSDLFFKQSVYTSGSETGATAFDLPVVTAGASLGNFSAAECGFDVVLSYGDYALPAPNDEFVFDLAYARAAEALIDTTAETDAYKKKVTREQVFQFLDPAAYYGFHYRENGVVKLVDSSGAKTSKKDAQIYTEVIQNFYTKNKLYLYIQSDRTRSYNFYGNYFIDGTGTSSHALKMGLTDTTLAAIDYDAGGWPLIIQDAAQAHSNARNTLYLQFVTDNNVNTMLYGQVAEIDNAQANNFCDAVNLLVPLDANGIPSTLTKMVQLSNPATGSDNNKINVSTFNLLIYNGTSYSYVTGQTVDDNGIRVDNYNQSYDLSDLFGLINAMPLLVANGTHQVSSLVDYRVQLINYNDNRQKGISAIQKSIFNDILETGNGDLNRVTYVSVSIDLLANAISPTGKISLDTKSNPSVIGSLSDELTYELSDPFFLDFTTFMDDTLEINALSIDTTDGSIPNKIIIGVTKNENNQLIMLIESKSEYINSRLTLMNLSDEQLISVEGINYFKYLLGIVSEDGTGNLVQSMPLTPVVLYSLDNYIFFSNDYSQHMTPDLSNIAGDTNDNI
jgi:hypothetical protein